MSLVNLLETFASWPFFYICPRCWFVSLFCSSRCVIFCHVSIPNTSMPHCVSQPPSSILSFSLFAVSCTSFLGNSHFHRRKSNSNPANLHAWRCPNNEVLWSQTMRNVQNTGRPRKMEFPSGFANLPKTTLGHSTSAGCSLSTPPSQSGPC